MSKKTSPALIGGFVVGAVILIAAAVALFGGSELFAKRNVYVAYFEDQTKGLRIGSNVVMNGVRIGYVSGIALLIDEATLDTITQVVLEILPDTYITMRHGEPIGEGMDEFIDHDQLINSAGLRAQLEIESFITGQLSVRVDFRPDTEPVLRGFDPPYREIPTIPSDIQELLEKMQRWVSNVRDNVDVGAIANELEAMLRGLAELTNSSDVRATLSGLNAFVNDQETQAVGDSVVATLSELRLAIAEARVMIGNANEGIDALGENLTPVLARLNETLIEAEETLQVAAMQLGGDSEQIEALRSTIHDVQGAARALRDFFDYLERNPEALIRGKN